MTAVADYPVHLSPTVRLSPRAAAVHSLAQAFTAAGIDPARVDLEAATTEQLLEHGAYNRIPATGPAQLAQLAHRHGVGGRGDYSPWEVVDILRGAAR